MPIYIEFEGIKGSVKPNNRASGANFGLSDGSVRNIRGSSGHKFTLERTYDGVSVVSNNTVSGASINAIEVSRISFPNSLDGAVDARFPNAVAQARMIFEAQRTRVTTLGLVFSVSENGANKLRHSNNLRQVSLAALGKISTVKFLITDNSNPSAVIITLENVLLSESLLNGNLMGVGKKVNIALCKTDNA